MSSRSSDGYWALPPTLAPAGGGPTDPPPPPSRERAATRVEPHAGAGMAAPRSGENGTAATRRESAHQAQAKRRRRGGGGHKAAVAAALLVLVLILTTCFLCAADGSQRRNLADDAGPAANNAPPSKAQGASPGAPAPPESQCPDNQTRCFRKAPSVTRRKATVTMKAGILLAMLAIAFGGAYFIVLSNRLKRQSLGPAAEHSLRHSEFFGDGGRDVIDANTRSAYSMAARRVSVALGNTGSRTGTRNGSAMMAGSILGAATAAEAAPASTTASGSTQTTRGSLREFANPVFRTEPRESLQSPTSNTGARNVDNGASSERATNAAHDG